MTAIKTTAPLKFVQGTTVIWQMSLADYLPPTWGLKYIFVENDLQKIIEATAAGTDHLVTISKEVSATFTAGIFSWQAIVTDGTSRYVVNSGTTEVLPDFEASANGLDNRSHVKIVLDALSAMIEGKASKDQLSYSIAGRSISRLSPEELLTWRDRYAADYNKEKRAARKRNGQDTGQTIKVSF